MLKVVDGSVQTLSTITSPTAGTSVTARSMSRISAQANITVNTPAAVTVASSAVNTTTDAITATAHGFLTGLVVQASTSSALPSGLSTSTNYYVIKLTANTFQLASSLANALAGTQIDLTTQGTGNQTFTPTAIGSGSIQLQKSNDNSNWTNDGSAVTVSATGSFWVESTATTAKYYRVYYSLASGSYSSSTYIYAQGDLT